MSVYRYTAKCICNAATCLHAMHTLQLFTTVSQCVRRSRLEPFYMHYNNHSTNTMLRKNTCILHAFDFKGPQML